MACQELAALRLGMMNVMGIENDAGKVHDTKEIGDNAHNPGPIKSLTEAQDFATLQQFFDASIADLEERVSKFPADEPKLPYYRSLLILSKKVECELVTIDAGLKTLYRDLDEMHDFVHEMYPAAAAGD